MVARKSLLALLLCVEVASTAHAADTNPALGPGFQVGAGLIQGSWHFTVPDIPGSQTAHALGYQVSAGYRLMRYVAFETSYIDGGSLSHSVVLAPEEALTLTARPHIATVTAMGILPLGQDFALFARVGGDHLWYDTDVALTGVGRATLSQRSNQVIGGAGASLYVDRALVRLEYEQTKLSPNTGGITIAGQLRLISVSIVWLL